MAHALCLGRARVVPSVGSSDFWPSGKRQGRQGKAGEVGKVDRLPPLLASCTTACEISVRVLQRAYSIGSNPATDCT